MTLLEVNDLRAGYNAGDVLHGVSVTVEAGEIVAVLGSNGAGKSTLLTTIMGLLPARAGSMCIDGEEITAVPTASRVKKGLALAPEGREVFASLSVEENLLLGHYARFRKSRAARAELDGVYSIFPRLADRRNQLAGDLSGGEQQMLALGRPLMAEPRCLLVDELSLGLAPAMVDEISERLYSAARERELALCIVEQNTTIALELANRAYVLKDGAVSAAGRSNELDRSGLLEDAYLRTAISSDGESILY